MSPQRKDIIPNQDRITLGLSKYQCLPPYIPSFSSVFKSLRKESNYDNPETIDTSHNDKYDTLLTNRYYSIENVKTMRNTNDDDE